MKKALFLLVLGCISISTSFSQTVNPPSIRVIGTAELEVVPDEIYVSFTLREFMKDKKKMMLEELESAMVNYVEKVVKVQKSDLSMESYDARLIAMKRKNNRDEMLSKTYEVKLKHFAQVTDIYLAMDSLSIINPRIVRLSHSKMDEYKKQIKIDAIKAARAKADYLMEALGQKAGKAIWVYENSGYVYVQDGIGRSNYNMGYLAQSNSYSFENNVSGLSYDYDNRDQNGISSGKIRLNYSIDVTFGIE